MKRNYLLLSLFTSGIILLTSTGCNTKRFDKIDQNFSLQTQKLNSLSEEISIHNDELLSSYNELKKQNENLAFRLEQAEKAIQAIRELHVKASPELEQQILSLYHQSVVKSENDLKQRNAEIISNIQNDYTQTLDKIQNELSLLAQQKIQGNEEQARLSFAEVLKCLENEDYDGAKVYCINAINHSPNKFEYFSKLVDIVDINTPNNISDYEQIRGIIQLGLYQVDQNDVPKMVNLLETINDTINNLSSTIANEQLNQNNEQTETTLNSVKCGEFSWENIINNFDTISLANTRLEKLKYLSSSDNISQTDVDWCETESQKTTTLLETTVALQTIDNSLSKAQDILNHAISNTDELAASNTDELAAANSMIQTANNVLSRCWNINFDLLPPNYNSKLKEDANRIAELEQEFNRVKSQPAITKVQNLQNEIQEIFNQSWSLLTPRIKKAQEKIQEILPLMSEIYDKDTHAQIEKDIQEYSKTIKKLDIERYTAYQNWAVGKCKEAFEKYQQEKIVNKDDAVSFLRDYLLEVDRAQLSPAVSRLYDAILSKLFAEMNWEKNAELEIELATQTKTTMEDF